MSFTRCSDREPDAFQQLTRQAVRAANAVGDDLPARPFSENLRGTLLEVCDLGAG
jgi:hypothetical protein